MTCTIGKLRGVRYAAFQVGAARGADDAQAASSLCAIFKHAFNNRFQSFLGTAWVAAPITTSAAPHDVTSGRQSDSNQRPNQSQRRNPRQQDSRADGAGQQRGQQPRQGGAGGGERPRASPGGQPRDQGGPRMRSEDRRGSAPHDAGGSGSGSGGGGGRGLQRRGDDRAIAPASLEPHLSRSSRPAAASAPPPAPPASALQRWDLVAHNAPQRVFNLIGDPRSGVADDTTTNPFGEVTVDLVHHQPSNEVYWFKYEFAGRQVYGAHRDARLSDYTRNLMYLLRAKDPKRWTIPALAEKFRIRRQRVLAILALKELEAHRLEAGKLLSGPLSAYSLPVYLEDVHLDPNTGAPTAATPPLPSSGGAAAAASPASASGQASSSASSSPSSSSAVVATSSARHHMDVVLPQVLSATRRLQSWLLELLREHGYDTVRLREALVSELQLAEELATKVLGGSGGGGTSGGSEDAAEGTAASSSSSYLREELAAYRTAVEGMVAALEGVLSCSPLLAEERRVASLRTAVQSALAAGGDAVLQKIRDMPLSYSTTTAITPTTTTATAAAEAGAAAVAEEAGDAAMPAGGGGGAAGAAPSGGLEEVQQRLREILQPVLQAPEGDDDGGTALLLHRAFFSLAPYSRAALLCLLPDLSARLNADGVDLARAVKDTAYRGPAAAAAAGAAAGAGAGGARRLSVDVFGFAPVASERLATLAEAVGAVEAARAALVGKVAALGPTAGQTAGPAERAAPPRPPLPSAADLAAARSLVRQYVAADVAWSELQVPVSAVGRRAQTTTLDPAKKRRALEVLSEADPTAVPRALQTEAALQLRNRRAFTEADAMAAGVGAAAAAAAAAGRPPPARPGDRASWDALAAYLEVKVAGKVYGTGSGERHVTHLPSFPAFEGYSLDELDRAKEGELSALNRKVAERLDAEMYDRFRQDLLYNLGLRGEKLRRPPPGQPAWPTNLLTALERPVVVYDIAADGATRYPPLYVASGDGTRRQLNDQEKVFQERRAERPRLPYYMGRISRVPELQ